jgi:hypothetical protein
MLKITIGWDWFYDESPPEEQEAFEKGWLSACVREDGDDNAAIVAATKGVKAPEEHTRLATYNPCVGDCFLAIAWDDRYVECEPDDEEDGGWSL